MKLGTTGTVITSEDHAMIQFQEYQTSSIISLKTMGLLIVSYLCPRQKFKKQSCSVIWKNKRIYIRIILSISWKSKVGITHKMKEMLLTSFRVWCSYKTNLYVSNTSFIAHFICGASSSVNELRGNVFPSLWQRYHDKQANLQCNESTILFCFHLEGKCVSHQSSLLYSCGKI